MSSPPSRPDSALSSEELASSASGLVPIDQGESLPSKRSRTALRQTFPAGIENSVMSVSHRKLGSAEEKSEPCQYNGQRSRRFPCGQHGFRIGLEGTLEAVEELLHGLCRHAVPDGLVRAEAVVIRLDELDRPVLRRGCIRRALVVVPLALERPEERLRDRIVVAAAGAAHGEPHVVRCRPGGELGARVLASAVAVEHGPSCDMAARTGHLEGRDHEARPHVVPHAPADDHARAQVYDHGQADEAARGPEIGYAAHELRGRDGAREAPPHEAGPRGRIPVRHRRPPGGIGADAAYPQLGHAFPDAVGGRSREAAVLGVARQLRPDLAEAEAPPARVPYLDDGLLEGAPGSSPLPPAFGHR